MAIERHYTGKDVDMLTAISAIARAAKDNKTFLQSKRSNWADPFFDTLITNIDSVVQTYLGVDSAKQLRTSTQLLNSLQTTAYPALSEMKVQIEEDYRDDKTRRAEILRELGFTDYFKKAVNDQEALVNLLYQFKQNMTAALQTEITGLGTLSKTITAVIGYADEVKNANVSQESFKASRKTVTVAGMNAFNTIYDEVISVARQAYRFFKGQPDKQAAFSYAKVKKNLNNEHSSSNTKTGNGNGGDPTQSPLKN